MNTNLILYGLEFETVRTPESGDENSNTAFGEKTNALMTAFSMPVNTAFSPATPYETAFPAKLVMNAGQQLPQAPTEPPPSPLAAMQPETTAGTGCASAFLQNEVQFERIITQGTFTDNTGMDGLYARIDNATFTGYLYGGSAADDGSVVDTTSLVINNGTYSRVYAGNRINGEWLSISGDSSIVINDGYYKGAVVCGDHILTGAVSRTGNTYIRINGGRFNKIVCGGANLDSTDNLTVSEMTGDINMTIAGGIFRNKIFVGMLSTYLMDSTRISHTGDINLAIDTSENEITMLGPNVTLGNSGFVSNYGNATITITGNHAWNYQGRVEASCEAAARKSTSSDMKGKNTPFSPDCCTGKTTMVFDGFTGQIDCYFTLFSDCIFKNNSRIDFTSPLTEWSMVRDWSFEWGCFASGLEINGFHQDNLSFDLTGWDGDDWTVLQGKESAFMYFDQAQSVIIGGEEARWNAERNAWLSDSYMLTLKSSEQNSVTMVVSTAHQEL